MEAGKRTIDLNSRKNSFLIVIGAGVIFAFILIIQTVYTKDTYTDDILKLRKEKDEMFKTSAKSPLADSSKPSFKGLSYFEADKSYRVMATFIPNEKYEIVKMPQNKPGETEEYIVAGKVEFSLQGRQHWLTAFQQNPKESTVLFIPFRDNTNGKSTYGGGRYLEDARIVDNRVELDFNLAYNPYCVYNYRYICPVPPPENKLDIEVKAGEKSYGEE